MVLLELWGASYRCIGEDGLGLLREESKLVLKVGWSFQDDD